MKTNILVVDDEDDIRFLLKKILEKEGYGISEAESAKKALEKLSSEKVDLVLLDVMMPEMDGVELSRKMREDASLKKIPIIMLTVMGAVEDKEWGFDYGLCDAYVTKPIIRKMLLDTITWVLKNAKK